MVLAGPTAMDHAQPPPSSGAPATSARRSSWLPHAATRYSWPPPGATPRHLTPPCGHHLLRCRAPGGLHCRRRCAPGGLHAARNLKEVGRLCVPHDKASMAAWALRSAHANPDEQHSGVGGPERPETMAEGGRPDPADTAPQRMTRPRRRTDFRQAAPAAARREGPGGGGGGARVEFRLFRS
jgi:hypothetical protein